MDYDGNLSTDDVRSVIEAEKILRTLYARFDLLGSGEHIDAIRSALTLLQTAIEPR